MGLLIEAWIQESVPERSFNFGFVSSITTIEHEVFCDFTNCLWLTWWRCTVGHVFVTKSCRQCGGLSLNVGLCIADMVFTCKVWCAFMLLFCSFFFNGKTDYPWKRLTARNNTNKPISVLVNGSVTGVQPSNTAQNKNRITPLHNHWQTVDKWHRAHEYSSPVTCQRERSNSLTSFSVSSPKLQMFQYIRAWMNK